MPNRRRLSTKRSASAWASGGASSIENSPLAPLKSRFHSAWPGVAGKGRIEDALDLRLLLQPGDDLGRVRLMHGQAGGRRAQALERAVGIVRADGLAQQPGVAPDLVGAALAGRYRPHDQVGMAGDILGDGDDRDVGAERERAIEAGASPGVVDGEQGLAARQQPGQRRHVLDVVDDGARVIEIDHAGLGLETLLHLLVAARIELAGDAALGEIVDGYGARRPVDRLGQQDVIAGSERRQEGVGDRRQPGREQHGARPALDLVDGILERKGGRRAVGSVGERALALRAPRLHGLARADVAIEHGGGANHRRVHRPHLPRHLGARRVHQPRLLPIAHRLGLLVLQHLSDRNSCPCNSALYLIEGGDLVDRSRTGRHGARLGSYAGRCYRPPRAAAERVRAIRSRVPVGSVSTRSPSTISIFTDRSRMRGLP